MQNPGTRFNTRLLAAAVAIALLVSLVGPQVHAQAITPFGTFGSQPTFTFGGTGIPNDWVMTNSNASALGVVLGLSATQRYDNPALTNNGAGTFFAQPGVDPNSPSASDPFALWNFDFYAGGENLDNYAYTLFYDFDPAAGNSQAGHGQLDPVLAADILAFINGQPAPNPVENSWNLGMDFLEAPLIGAAPSHAAFDPTVSGEYTFAFTANDLTTGAEVARSAIRVDVGAVNVVPEPGAMSLLALGLVGLAGAGFRNRRRGS